MTGLLITLFSQREAIHGKMLNFEKYSQCEAPHFLIPEKKKKNPHVPITLENSFLFSFTFPPAKEAQAKKIVSCFPSPFFLPKQPKGWNVNLRPCLVHWNGRWTIFVDRSFLCLIPSSDWMYTNTGINSRTEWTLLPLENQCSKPNSTKELCIWFPSTLAIVSKVSRKAYAIKNQFKNRKPLNKNKS